jgi:hypothetical protein
VSEDSQQATVRGKMRSEQIDHDEDEESNTESHGETFIHNSLQTILRD